MIKSADRIFFSLALFIKDVVLLFEIKYWGQSKCGKRQKESVIAEWAKCKKARREKNYEKIFKKPWNRVIFFLAKSKRQKDGEKYAYPDQPEGECAVDFFEEAEENKNGWDPIGAGPYGGLFKEKTGNSNS